jgi:hypothetical protein
MEANSATKVALDRLDRRPGRDASGKIGDEGRIVFPCFFYNDGIPHHASLLSWACLKMLFNVPGGRSSEGLPAIRNTPALCRMLELTMASRSDDKIPSVALEQFHYFTDFHLRPAELIETIDLSHMLRDIGCEIRQDRVGAGTLDSRQHLHR